MSPQLVVNVIILFLEDLLILGVGTFFSRCPTADVSLQTTLTNFGEACATAEKLVEKIN